MILRCVQMRYGVLDNIHSLFLPIMRWGHEIEKVDYRLKVPPFLELSVRICLDLRFWL